MPPMTVLPDQIADSVREAWGIDTGPVSRLSGGQEVDTRCVHLIIMFSKTERGATLNAWTESVLS
ncbi:hypothetical protein C1Y40_00571 [Mycobacterium talmoniae]|uniref:Uncharacterized protein n=1 Tax=Mycobacterium talmoniae TaxID=1858794 RepID=A0A2S8BRF8_9MYCO|nr:hypothetical protein C1Y40_00571 [Mycobacterium talmoniae]